MEWITEQEINNMLDFGKLNEIAIKLQEAIVDIIHNSGIYYRIFYRVKTAKSLQEKLNRGGYGLASGEKCIQDLIGLRIVLYYGDDLSIGQKIMQNTFLMIGGWEKTENKEDQFAASKINGVFCIPEEFMANYRIPEGILPIEPVFEVQFRTMFFEGWHEIEHDMRYKTHFADDTFWKGSPELSRILNCIVANLELCDWSMIGLFDQLSEYHYKEKNWEMMLKSKFRLRMSDQHLSGELKEFFDQEPEAAEQIYRCTRSQLIKSLLGTEHGEITYDLIVRILNEKYVHNEVIAEICEMQDYAAKAKAFKPQHLRRLESSDVFYFDVTLRHKEGVPLENELAAAAGIVQGWAKEKLSDIFDDISGEPENYKRQTLGYQLATGYHKRLLYYEMEMYHLDMEHPGTLWQMQVLIQRVRLSDDYLTLWIHSICRHPQNMSAAAVFSKPLFLNELSARIGLEDVEPLRTSPILVENEETYEKLLHLIISGQRRLPVVVLAASEGGEENGAGKRQLRRKKGDFFGILHAGKLAHIIGLYAHVYLLDREYSEKFGKAVGKEPEESFGSVSIYDCASGLGPSNFFTEQQILKSRFDYNKYVYYEGDVYERAFRHKLVEMIKRKILEKRS